MNKRITRINKFLKEIAEKRNSNSKPLSIEEILAELRTFEIPNDSKGSIANIHEDLIKFFNDKRNINVFKEPGQTHCRLINFAADNKRWNDFNNYVENKKVAEGISATQNNDPIKIYVGLDKEHIEKGARIIFTFLSEYNIEHDSTISSAARTDDIVIRVYSKKDADKLINFINTHTYLNKGHLNPNPFCFNSGIVALAQDNYNSYNNVLAVFIQEYLEDIRKRGIEPNKDTFYNFVMDYDISNINFLKEARNTSKIDQENDTRFIGEIKNLIILSLTSNNMEDFYSHATNVKGNKKEELTDKQILDTLMYAHKCTWDEHGLEWADNAVLSFLKNGDTGGFTRYEKGNTKKPVREKMFGIDYIKCRKVILEQAKNIKQEEKGPVKK